MRADARAVVAAVVDPEMPMLTLEDLGVVRGVEVDGGSVTVTITPTYSGCPAIEVIREDLGARLTEAGYASVEVRVVLSPAWSTDWISERGLRLLAEHGIAPPARIAAAVPQAVGCPRCGSAATEEISRFGPTPCTALRRCSPCREPFEHMKTI